MDNIRNGRVIIDGTLNNIMLPSNGGFAFEFSSYRPPFIGDYVFCISGDTVGLTALESNLGQNIPMLDSIAGYENYNLSKPQSKKYKIMQADFDILNNVQLSYAHPDLDDIMSQLNVSSLTPFFMPKYFNLGHTGEKVPMEVIVAKERPFFGRTATFEQPVKINGEFYLLELKGVNCGNWPLDLDDIYIGNNVGECRGGLTKKRMEHSVDILKYLNSKGYDNVLLVAAYQIPEIKQFDGQEMGAYIRAVKCSPSISHYSENLNDVAESLNMSGKELAEYILRGAARDMATIWKAGIAHDGPVHEQNIRIGSIVDFTDSKYVSDNGFKKVVYDAASFIFSSQKIMEKIIGNHIKWPSKKLMRSNPEEAERISYRAQETQAEIYKKTREIIVDELNNQLGLKLPSMIGTTSLGAEIFNMQRKNGLTNLDENPIIVYDTIVNMQFLYLVNFFHFSSGPETMEFLYQLLGKKANKTIKHLTLDDLLVQR